MSGRGPHNDITDVPGIKVGSADNARIKTGVTVVLPDQPAVVAGDVRGGGPGTRETDLLDPSTLVDKADAIVLAGGSTYGLGAADGVCSWLGAHGRGFRLAAREGVPPSPIVPAAILYDLANGGDKNWGQDPPYRQLGHTAVAAASGARLSLGSKGAGYGAMAGAEIGGLGSSSFVTDDGLIVGALVAVNSFGSVRRPGSRAFWAAPFEIADEFGGVSPKPADSAVAADWPPDTKLGAAAPRANTTIGVIAVNAALSQAEARRVAIMAQDGLARAIRPVHGPTDGDVIFTLAVGPRPSGDPLSLTRIGIIAADCMARAVARAVYEADRQSQGQ